MNSVNRRRISPVRLLGFWAWLLTATALYGVNPTPTSAAKSLPAVDSDADGLPDIDEIRFGSNPFVVDTDTDGANDLAEFQAGTNPRDNKSYPLFAEGERDRQILTGDLLRLNPLILRPFNLLTNITFETNDATEAGGEPTIVTNTEISTNFATFQWFRDGLPLAGETNSTLVRFGMDRSQGGRYRLEARLEDSAQNGRGMRWDVLGVREIRALRQPAGSVVGWGRELGAPSGPISDAFQVSAGFVHSYAILSDGRLQGWGTNTAGQLSTPSDLGPILSVGSGAVHTLAVRTNGQVVAWGNNQYGQTNVPPFLALQRVLAVAAGNFHSLALLADGTVVAWGDNSAGQCEVPPSLTRVLAIAAGGSHSVALTSDGRVVCWGGNAVGQSTVPAGLSDVARIAAGGNHTLALTRTGRVVAWGDSSQRQTRVPATLPPAIAIGAGASSSFAVTAAGRVVAWGLPANAVTPPASATNVVAVSAGFQAAYAIGSRPDPDADGLDESFERSVGSDPARFDSDTDGLEDGIEVRLGLNPVQPDSDEDGIPDLAEVEQSADSDGDGLTDADEIRRRLDPFNADTDGDRAIDGDEVAAGTDPRNPASFPLFRLESRGRQLLSGDSLVLRAVDLHPAAPQVIVTNVIPGVVVTDPDTGETTTNAPTVVISTNSPAVPASAFQWFRGTTSLGGQTNPTLVVHRVTTADSGAYRLTASSGTHRQESATLDVLVLAASNRPPAFRRSGTVVAWGDDTLRQSSPPPGLTDVVQVAAGLGHSLALRRSGEVIAWGSNVEGQVAVPTNLTGVVSIAAGALHSVALTADGQVFCWGDNSQVQCTPPEGMAGKRLVSIAAGALHTVALDDTGVAWFWGDTTGGQGSIAGQAGVQVFAGHRSSALLRASGRLVVSGSPSQPDVQNAAAVASGTDFHVTLLRNGGLRSSGAANVPADIGPVLAVVAGERFWAALRADGSVRVGGGDGLTVTNVPSQARSIATFAAGGRHVLAVVANPDSDDDGLDVAQENQLGSGLSTLDSDADGIEDGIEARLGIDPVMADTDGDGLSDFEEILNGLPPLDPSQRPDGRLELGLSVRLSVFSLGGAPYRIESSTDGLEWTNRVERTPASPGTWTADLPLTRAGEQFRVVTPVRPVPGLDGEPVLGTVRAWGENTFGQIEVPMGLAGVSDLSAGTWHTLARLVDGTVRAWGNNVEGQASVPANLGSVVSVAAGGSHSLALLENGQVVGWGRNLSGQASPPTFAAQVRAIAAGGDFSIALLEGGSVRAWGADFLGQTQVPAGLTDVVAVAAGWSHGVALKADGTVVCWGNNIRGQCTVPGDLPRVAAVAAGDSHTVALLADGTVRVWGSSEEGQTAIPSGLAGVVAIRAGYNHTVVRLNDGSLVTWGGASANRLALPAGVTGPIAFSAGGAHTVVALQPLDTDGDGIDDREEIRIGSDPGVADTDQDGLADGLELVFGTPLRTPTEAPDGQLQIQSFLRLVALTLGTRQYQLESSVDLETWSAEGAAITGQNRETEWLLPAADTARSYRLRRE